LYVKGSEDSDVIQSKSVTAEKQAASFNAAASARIVAERQVEAHAALCTQHCLSINSTGKKRFLFVSRFVLYSGFVRLIWLDC
jgi:hypothetical protein